MAATPTPDGRPAVSPYLVVEDPAPLIQFLEQSFRAEEMLRDLRPEDTIRHAEVRIDDSVVMIGVAPDIAPKSSILHLYVDDVDAVYERALHAGATSVSEPEDQPYGDRRAGLKDPAGNTWWIATPLMDESEG